MLPRLTLASCSTQLTSRDVSPVSDATATLLVEDSGDIVGPSIPGLAVLAPQSHPSTHGLAFLR